MTTKKSEASANGIRLVRAGEATKFDQDEKLQAA